MRKWIRFVRWAAAAKSAVGCAETENFGITLVGEPESERRFQIGVSRLRVALALVLIASVALAVASGSIEHLR